MDRTQWEAGGQDRRTNAGDAKHAGDVLGLGTDGYFSSLLCATISSKTASVSNPHGSHGNPAEGVGGLQGKG